MILLRNNKKPEKQLNYTHKNKADVSKTNEATINALEIFNCMLSSFKLYVLVSNSAPLFSSSDRCVAQTKTGSDCFTILHVQVHAWAFLINQSIHYLLGARLITSREKTTSLVVTKDWTGSTLNGTCTVLVQWCEYMYIHACNISDHSYFSRSLGNILQVP
jgi:hypothetical protein